MVQVMVVFSNRRLGAASELLVSPGVAVSMLRETAIAASSTATGWWERELVRWLRDRAGTTASIVGASAPNPIDVGEVAWSPENFEIQRQFLLAAIQEAARTSEHARALIRWSAMIEAHPRDSVQVGRRWILPATA